MKKTISIILALVMIVCLAACGKEASKQEKDEPITPPQGDPVTPPEVDISSNPGCYVTISNKKKEVQTSRKSIFGTLTDLPKKLSFPCEMCTKNEPAVLDRRLVFWNNYQVLY